MKTFLRNNGLSLVVMALFLATFLGGQVASGWKVENAERGDGGNPPLSLVQYLGSAHFIEATAENWESEFFQMFIYVWVTAFLYQKGSAESKDPAKQRPPRPVTKSSPWPVRRGGFWKVVYSHSLSAAFALLFLISFSAHAYGSFRLENERRHEKHQSEITFPEHLEGSTFWFESFQNWQSEFLSIGCMVILSIYLREKGSPESKDLEAGHDETG